VSSLPHINAVDYVWSLVMQFLLCFCDHGLPVNYLPVLSLGNDAPAEESSVWWGLSHWEPSIIELEWNRAPAGGWLARWDRSFSEGRVVQNLLVCHDMINSVHFNGFSGSHLRLFEQLYKNKKKKSKDDFFSSSAFMPNTAFVYIKWKYKKEQGQMELPISRSIYWQVPPFVLYLHFKMH